MAVTVTPVQLGLDGGKTSYTSCQDPTYVEFIEMQAMVIMLRNTAGSTRTPQINSATDKIIRTSETGIAETKTLNPEELWALKLRPDVSRHVVNESSDPPVVTFSGADMSDLTLMAYILDSAKWPS